MSTGSNFKLTHYRYSGSICDISMDNEKSIAEGGNDNPPLEEAKANGLFIAHARTDLPAALDALDEAEKRIAELEADKARLDWLESRKYACFGISHYDGQWLFQIETGGYAERGAMLRAAIDAAMKPEGR